MTVRAFTVRRDVAAPAEAVFDALSDWPAHGRWVPLTVVRVTSTNLDGSPRPGGVGATFVGRTGVGPLAFDDPMTVTVWQPPRDGAAGRCEVVKTGRVVHGGAEFTVTPHGAGCRVEWSETIAVTGLRRLPLMDRVNAWVGAAAFGLVVRRMASEVVAAQGGDPARPPR